MKTIITVLLLLCASCTFAQTPDRVLVCACRNNPDSIRLAQHYMDARNIPASNLLLLDTAAEENTVKISLADFKSKMVIPIFDKMASRPHIDYIVLCRNLPIQVTATSRSVDSIIAGYSSMDQLKTTRIAEKINPYYTKSVPFDSHVQGIHLVTRLDGYSWSDAIALVDNSIAHRMTDNSTSLPTSPPILLETAPNMSSGGFAFFDTRIATASGILSNLKANVILDNSKTPLIPTFPLGGYFSWGSHASGFNLEQFKTLQFAPGAIGDMIYSFNGQSLRFPGAKGSQSAWLIHQGITGIKAFATEPGASSISDPTFLFPNYLNGRNLAESFYSAAPFICWMDIIVGDPLCTFK